MAAWLTFLRSVREPGALRVRQGPVSAIRIKMGIDQDLISSSDNGYPLGRPAAVPRGGRDRQPQRGRAPAAPGTADFEPANGGAGGATGRAAVHARHGG